MKQSMVMLAVIGMMHFSANAQNKEIKKSEFDINYKVCRINGKYTTCSDNTPTVVNTLSYIRKVEMQKAKAYSKTLDGLRRYDTYTRVQPLQPVTVVAPKPIVKIDQRYEGTSAAYHGNPTPENDGIAKNKERNINYLNTSTYLPANDGGLASR
jgi:hypothetical protein